MSLPIDSKARKAVPLFEGFVGYFPDAMAEVAKLSNAGNDKHNGPGTPLRWDRSKSTDHADCIMRHLAEYDAVDPEDGLYHAVKVAWRGMAQLQELLERKHGLPLPRNAFYSNPADDWRNKPESGGDVVFEDAGWFSPDLDGDASANGFDVTMELGDGKFYTFKNCRFDFPRADQATEIKQTISFFASKELPEGIVIPDEYVELTAPSHAEFGPSPGDPREDAINGIMSDLLARQRRALITEGVPISAQLCVPESMVPPTFADVEALVNEWVSCNPYLELECWDWSSSSPYNVSVGCRYTQPLDHITVNLAGTGTASVERVDETSQHPMHAEAIRLRD